MHRRVRESLLALPEYFRSDIVVRGILATDIFTLNAPFAAAIEEQTVAALNDLRSVWDPDEKYRAYSFVRQPQTFPDVRLQRRLDPGGVDIAMGIELKGWYLFAKEGEPSFRFAVSPHACHDRDLLVVFPWALNNVISGTAKLFAPYVESAKYAAEFRNWHWQREHARPIPASNPAPYPAKADEVADRAEKDAGGNFGRIARTNLLDEFKGECDRVPLAGIQVSHWRRFFRVFKENSDSSGFAEAVDRTINMLLQEQRAGQRQDDLAMIRESLERIARSLAENMQAPKAPKPRKPGA